MFGVLDQQKLKCSDPFATSRASWFQRRCFTSSLCQPFVTPGIFEFKEFPGCGWWLSSRSAAQVVCNTNLHSLTAAPGPNELGWLAPPEHIPFPSATGACSQLHFAVQRVRTHLQIQLLGGAPVTCGGGQPNLCCISRQVMQNWRDKKKLRAYSAIFFWSHFFVHAFHNSNSPILRFRANSLT